MVIPLNDIQIQKLREFSKATADARIGRIMCDSKSVNVCTGHLVGGNVIHQMIYWGYTEAWFQRVRQYLMENNPGKVFHIVYNDKEDKI